MRCILALVMLLALLLGSALAADEPVSAVPSQSPDEVRITNSLSSAPIAFTKNMGQWPDSILFRADIGEAVMWIVKDGIYYQFTKRISRPQSGEGAFAMGLGPWAIDPAELRSDSVLTALVKAQFLDASPNVEVIGLDELEHKCNYFIGNDPSKWRVDVPNYTAVALRNIYPGVTATLRKEQGRLELRLHGPEEAVANIRAAYSGGAVHSLADGIAVIVTSLGEKRFRGFTPLSVVAGGLPDLALTPADITAVVYSTYLGGSDWDESNGVAVDGSGSAFVVGTTASTDFPTSSQYQTDQPGSDVLVTKLSASGNSLVYSTYLGGSGNDYGWGIAVDGSGSTYLTGYTFSTNYPTQNAYQTDQAREDVFVTKLSASGNSLVYSTYLGGSQYDYGYGIAVDGSDNAYVTGFTYSPDYPAQNPYQVYQAGYDVFITKLSASGSSLAYSTFLGGSSDDQGRAIAVDELGSAYVTGHTGSSSFPTQNPYQTNQAFEDAFVTRLSAAGNSLVYSTYLGGNGNDYAWGIAVDDSANAYITGFTYSSDFPNKNPYQADQGLTDAFVTKLHSAGNSLVYSTYLGGSDTDKGHSIALDSLNNAYVTGNTQSTNFPTLDPYQVDQDTNDVFVTRLSESGSSLVYSTYLGGNGIDYGWGIAVDDSSNAYISGTTGSDNFPILNYHQTDQGGTDVFITKLSYLLDSDSDGVPDNTDNCVSIANPSQLNTDGDTEGDACDMDDDNDGVPDGSDNCRLIANPDQLDTDGDSFGNVCDSDDDNDGYPDGVDPGPLDPYVCADVDGDGCDDCAVGIDGFGPQPDNLPNDDGLDSDYDGICNIGDADDDNDGIVDGEDTNPLYPWACTDADADGCDDCTVGVDGFGPLPDYRPNSDGLDSDADGLCNSGDPCPSDPLNDDVDGDGVCTVVDNCPAVSNPGQEDSNSDGIGNACCCVDLTGNVNATGIVDGGDLALLVAYLTNNPGSKPTLPCPAEANVNGSGIIDGGDLALLVAYLTNAPAQKPTLPNCP